MVTSWSTILSLPLNAALEVLAPASLIPRKLVTSSSRARMRTTIPGATPVSVLTISGSGH